MAYRLIQAGGDLNSTRGTVIFLGGSSRGNDWRKFFYHELKDEDDITFISPFRESYPNPETQPEEHNAVVEWERNALSKCDVAIFWLGSGLANQASRVEIGYAIGTNKCVIVGAEDSFLGLEHLSAFGGFVLADSLEAINIRLKNEILALEQ